MNTYFISLPFSHSVCLQYARETDQLNKINRNESRQKLFSLDPETQVQKTLLFTCGCPMIYLFHY